MVYLGGDYEEVIPPTGATHDRIQRVQVTAVVRQMRRRNASTQMWEAVYHEYAHRDHLGSVDAITDGSGTVLQKTSFDPYGGRRTTAWNADLSTTGLDALRAVQDSRGSRGFTDHEHLNRTGFVHMNGRVYDPRIGRFVSPDPIVQAPWFSQSYNRYAYVFGSPVSFTDPSGFQCIENCVSFTGGNVEAAYFAGAYLGMQQEGIAGAGGENSYRDAWWMEHIVEPQIELGARGELPWQLELKAAEAAAGTPVGGNENESGSLLPSPGDVLGEAGRAAFYINLYVLGVDIRGPSDLVAAAPIAAITLFGGPGAGRAATTVFKTSHYAPRLIEKGVDVAKAEKAVAERIEAMRPNLSPGAKFEGRFEVDGVLIEYGAYPLMDGSVNVGTIFPVK